MKIVRLVAKKLIFFGLILCCFSCRLPTNFGFYQPITMDLTAPDGTPEYKAGWRDGCRSAIANGTFLNSAVYQSKAGPTFSPVYQHDSQYQAGWGQAWYACMSYNSAFVNYNSMRHAPLQ